MASAPFPASRFLPRVSSKKDCDLQDGISPLFPRLLLAVVFFTAVATQMKLKLTQTEIFLALFTLKVYRIFALVTPGNFSQWPVLSPVLNLEAIARTAYLQPCRAAEVGGCSLSRRGLCCVVI